MSEEDAGRIEYERQQGQISPGSLDWYRDRLADPSFARDFPEHHAALSESVTRALSGSGQSLTEPPDPRSTPQQIHDARFGISYSDGKPALPENLIRAIENNQPTSDPHLTAQALSAIGRSYRDDIVAATRLLEQCGLKVQAATLSAATLAQLSIFADHLARHATGRPK
jgi:hypothetical protein